MPRLENSQADALAKLATAPQEDLGRLTPIKHLPDPSVSVDNGEVSPMMSEPSWMDPIWDYLVDGKVPSYPKEASKLRARSARFTVHRGLDILGPLPIGRGQCKFIIVAVEYFTK